MRVCMMERRGVNRSWRESNFREVVWSAGARIEAGGIDGSSGLAFIDENLDVVERVWRGSGFAIDSLVGSALMKWPSGNSSDLIPMNAHSPPSSHTFHLFPLDHPFFPFFFFFFFFFHTFPAFEFDRQQTCPTIQPRSLLFLCPFSLFATGRAPPYEILRT